MDPSRLKVAVVTGGGSGIGASLGAALVAQGTSVVLADVQPDKAHAVAERLRASGGEALAVGCDVADQGAVVALAEAAYARFGRVDLLCNNAGVIAEGSCTQTTDAQWRLMLEVNLMGVVNGCRVFLPRMLAHGGQILNTASTGAFLAGPSMGAYCASKFAVLGFSEALRRETRGSGVQVSVLCPGAVKTDLYAGLGAPEGDSAAELRALLDHGMDPDEVAAAALRGLARGAPYVFTHAQTQAKLERHFERILAAFADLQG